MDLEGSETLPGPELRESNGKGVNLFILRVIHPDERNAIAAATTY
jgi:hypothetical protein